MPSLHPIGGMAEHWHHQLGLGGCAGPPGDCFWAAKGTTAPPDHGGEEKGARPTMGTGWTSAGAVKKHRSGKERPLELRDVIGHQRREGPEWRPSGRKTREHVGGFVGGRGRGAGRCRPNRAPAAIHWPPISRPWCATRGRFSAGDIQPQGRQSCSWAVRVAVPQCGVLPRIEKP